MSVVVILTVMAGIISAVLTTLILGALVFFYFMLLQYPSVLLGLLALVIFVPVFIVVYFILIARM